MSDFQQTHKQIVDRYNAKLAIFNAMVNGRRISLLNSQEFKVSEMRTTICYIRKDLEKKNLPYVMRDEWIATGPYGKRIKEYWFEKKENKTDMDYEKKYKEALGWMCKLYPGLHGATKEDAEHYFPELRESEDERIRKEIVDLVKRHVLPEDKQLVPGGHTTMEEAITWLEKQKDSNDMAFHEGYTLGFEDGRKEQKPIKMEVYEVGKGTTICGQDYKCKKDYKEGNCWYIKDVVYHCSRDGYLTDQNGISWSCTPEWFKEYIQSNTEWAEEEKTHFVSGQFLQCKLSFDGFKEGEHYWLEYVGNDMYVGRSDNILNQKFHITPRQLFTLFSQELEEVQGPPQEEKQVSLNYEPPFDENPSDKEIVEALIKHLKEQDGFLTAIDSVSTKAILSWLEMIRTTQDRNRAISLLNQSTNN